jgi:raffinose/stachyose/melibiose transport system substrate-binding protein
MKTKTKYGSILLLTMATTLALSACGSSGKSGTPSPSGSPAATASGSKTENVTISYWTWVPTNEQMGKVIEAFQKENPNIKVETYVAESSAWQSKLLVAMQANEGPDVMGMQVGGILNQYADLLEPLKLYADKAWGTDWAKKFVPGSTEQTTARSSGQILALPINFTAQEFVLYNKAIFDEAGIVSVPKTYDELKQTVATLKAKGYDTPLVFGAKDGWHDVDMFNYLSQQFGPGKIYEAVAGKLPFTDPVFVNTMKAWKQMFDDGIIQKGALGLATYPDARDMYFYARKAAMFPTGTWHVAAAQEMKGTKIENDATGMFIFPQVGPNPAKPVASVDTAIAINKNSKKKEAAWKLVEFMTNGGGQQIMTDFIQGSPAKLGVVPNTLDQFKFDSVKQSIKYVNEQIGQSVGKRLLDYPELTNAIGNEMMYVAAGKKIEDALAEIQKVSEKVKR